MESTDRTEDNVMKMIHYFVIEQDYKPIIVTGIRNEIWLENFKNNPKLIRINTNYIHNDEQYKTDLRKAEIIMKNIKKKTYSLKMNLLNILVNVGENVNSIYSSKNIDCVKVNKIIDLKKNDRVISFFPTIKNKIFTKKSGIDEILRMTNDMNEKTRKDEKKLSNIFKNSKPVITYTLIGINVLIYLFTLPLSHDAYTMFMTQYADYYVYVQRGEIFRLLTSAFLHNDAVHLLLNMYALYIIGPDAERYYGKVKFLTIYTFSAIMGGLFSCVLNNTFSIGASGAIFGLFGALLYFALEYRATLEKYLKGQIIPIICINLMFSFAISTIDAFGHIGGLVGGVLSSMIVGIKDKDKNLDRVNGIIISIILIVFMSYMLMQK